MSYTEILDINYTPEKTIQRKVQHPTPTPHLPKNIDSQLEKVALTFNEPQLSRTHYLTKPLRILGQKIANAYTSLISCEDPEN